MTDAKDNQTIDIEEAITIETHHANIVEVQQTYGDNLPYQRDRLVNEVRFYMAQSAEAMLQMGKRLIVLKENELHGEFLNIIELDLGINRRTAQRMMQTTIKILNIDSPKATSLTLLSPTKLFDLVTLDDEELGALVEGGTVAGLTLDEIDAMSTRELKAALKKAMKRKTA